MSATAGQHIVVPAKSYHAHRALAYIIGICIGLGMSGSAWLYAQIPTANIIEDSVDYRMETACALPRNEGEMTVWTIINQESVCWRWQ